ncbi:chaperonin 10-like protein [Suillus bovinus]|uniref:chaperonin 10-like protein n=1 Tax=Suillus bovinus TaxID=48563 RepID=UPI001B85CC2F|nr:chaperonin 10-like protein [Suillus bovinus]KAG2149023.1 chaperonin 10-like protein [Suillus bovinus]
MTQCTNKPSGPIRRRLRLLNKAVQFLSRLDGRGPHTIHEASLNTSFHSLPLSQEQSPSIHSTFDFHSIPDMPDQQLALITPSKQASFAVASRKIPKPGPGEVLVKLQATALNPFDAKVHKDGTFIESYPAVLGTDGAGIVEEIGEGVTKFNPGERIFFHGAFDDNDLATFQQYCVVTTDFAAKVPRSLSLDEASTIACGLGTAAIGMYGTINGIGLIPPWDRGGWSKYKGWPILIFGGAGSVGNYVIQLAKLSGFSPIITTASLKHTEHLKSLGANHVIDRYLPLPALKQAVMKITGSRIHIMYDSISTAETQEAGWSLLAPGGKLVVTQPSLINKDIHDTRQVVPVDGSPQSDENWETGKRLWAHLERWVEDGHIRPNHVELLSGGLRAIPDALERFNAGKVDGVKMVVRPQET